MFSEVLKKLEIHYIESDFESWKNDFALKNGIHPYVIDYLTFKPTALHTQNPGSGETVFATPRSWERVSDILNIDSDITKDVVKNKIIGNVGAVEGNQFVKYCKLNHHQAELQDILNGKAKLPDKPEEMALLVDRLISSVRFLSYSDNADLSDIRKKRVQDVILALVRLPKAEYTVMGMKKLMDMNREATKRVFSGIDQPEVIRFVERHKYALGLSDSGSVIGKARDNWMALWK